MTPPGAVRHVRGLLMMAMLINGMTLIVYGPEAKFVRQGVALVAAVWADVRFGWK